MNYFLRKGRSVFDRVIEEELSAGERIIERNEEFISFVPFAATSPFNVWIMPLKSRANFLAAGTRELDLYAEILSSSLNKLDRVLSEPDMNILLKSAPLHGRHNQAAFNADCYFRWYTTITPRLGAGAMAGFELGSGIFSNEDCQDVDEGGSATFPLEGSWSPCAAAFTCDALAPKLSNVCGMDWGMLAEVVPCSADVEIALIDSTDISKPGVR
eukprot:Stramenopile-MAST_4_protein_5541